MQYGAGRGFWRCADRAVSLAACLLLSSTILSSAAFAQADEVSLTRPDQSALADPEAPIVVGTRAAIGTDKAAEKAAKGVVGGVIGSVLGGSDDGRRDSDRPDTVRDPTRKDDYVRIKAMDGGLETAARAQWTESGLLISVRIDDAPGKGTFHTIFLQACDGRRFYPIRHDIYKLWPERSVSVGWSRTTTADGEVVDRNSGSVSEAWGEGVGSGPIGSGQGIWQELGFERAHHGARQLGAYIDIDPAEFTRLGELGLFVHTTLPKREPVTTTASIWLVGPDQDGEPSVSAPEAHPDGWWGHCGGPPDRFVASAEATRADSDEDPEAEEAPACGSIMGTVNFDPARFMNVMRAIVVYVTGDCDFCPPKPEPEDVVIKEDSEGYKPYFTVVPKGAAIKIVNANEDEIDIGPEFLPSPVDDQPTHVPPIISKGESTEVTPTKTGGYLLASRWHKRSDAQVFVTPNRCYSIADEEGRYSIGELPPGEYNLKVYTHPKRTNFAEADVTVKAGEVTVRDFVLDRVVDKQGSH